MVLVKNITDNTETTKARAKNKLKAKALNTLSHEFQTPIHNILTSLTEMKTRPKFLKDPALTMYHKIATSSCQILFHKVNDMLDYSLFEQGRLLMNPEKMQIKECIVDMLETFEY